MSVNRYISKSINDMGFLQMQVLWLLKEPAHGYVLIKKLNDIKKTKITASTLYPVLNKLEKMKLIKSRKENRRKIYTLTPEGKKIMDTTCKEFCKTFGEIFHDFVCKKCGVGK